MPRIALVGEPVTAHDFVRSYRRALAPSLGSEYAYMYYVMKGAEDSVISATIDRYGTTCRPSSCFSSSPSSSKRFTSACTFL
ncbi:MAG: hypothetical protein HYX46_04710 [Betaproteobacteria bacterium]|nr:hypothetical protein [Betaproteobacteria bacterium]